MRDLIADPRRLPSGATHPTGIWVRARMPDGRFESVDLVALDLESLFTWLRSRGGANPWAEDVVRILLGHPDPFPPGEP